MSRSMTVKENEYIAVVREKLAYYEIAKKRQGYRAQRMACLDIYRYLNRENLIGFSFSKCAPGHLGLSAASRVMLSKSIELQGVLEKEDNKVGKKMRNDLISTLTCYQKKHAKQKQTILLCLNRFLNADLVRFVVEEYI
jgi:hypothetical protein